MSVPKLRFKRENGTNYPEWEEKRLGEVTSPLTSRNKDNKDYPVYSVNNKKGFIPQLEQFEDREVASNNKANYRVVRHCHFAYNPSRINVGSIAYLKERKTVIVSPLYVVFECTEIMPEYMNIYVRTQDFHNQRKANTAGSVRDSLSYDGFAKITILVPCLEEQKKIADFLSTVDEVIAQSEAEVQNFEQQKKAAMQKIFSQEVRFKREDGTEYPEWEEDIIGNCVNVTSCKRVHQSDWTDSGVPFYRAREIVALYNNEPITPLHISIEKYNALSKISGMISSGDLLVTGVGTIGVPYLVKESDKFYFKDGNIIWFQNEEKRALGSFLYYTLSTNEFQTKILQDSGKGTVHTFTIANAKETIIAIPCLEEQKKIADFLSAYDEAIGYAKQELDKWKELKKGLLQQMFV